MNLANTGQQQTRCFYPNIAWRPYLMKDNYLSSICQIHYSGFKISHHLVLPSQHNAMEFVDLNS